MPDLIVILVEPEKADNVGMIARAMKNFGFYELRVVRPMFESFDRAIAAAMRARDVIERMEILTTLEEARRGVDLMIGTTARVSRYSVERRAIPIRDLLSSISWDAVYGLVLGRESIGLTTEELSYCDIVATIPSSEDYPALNVANAAAIILYEFFLAFKDSSRFEVKPVPREAREVMIRYIGEVIDLLGGMRDRERFLFTMRRMIERTFPCGISEEEASQALGIIKAVRDALARVKGHVPETSQEL
ncbi:RNA methyltransferase [Candidatus Korarchaeum cryptofilum]|jgi:TrmH family RNA methyltransferase|uniref:tRNA/rRNA methyltransferase (SpoU) n=2 Tax=Candidatus Korarchaeum cryptofilum TaxID=498846 RepID=B1L7Q2_KORCO|nr:RNA methyltransferase [Candidatus Korarchaeum cryptofilum]ACB06879.1 tRNA/rRNA methyltransferase (SpoU) [Candidatus Korarchaeum cryptofilum OPF8]RSN69330.1 RNA methyltransferase [Candidatus Korarchaeum cryptofilum]